MKPEGKGEDFSGPIIKKIIQSDEILRELSEYLGVRYLPVIQLLITLAKVHNVCRNRELNMEL